jgi:hypothetical protein
MDFKTIGQYLPVMTAEEAAAFEDAVKRGTTFYYTPTMLDGWKEKFEKSSKIMNKRIKEAQIKSDELLKH